MDECLVKVLAGCLALELVVRKVVVAMFVAAEISSHRREIPYSSFRLNVHYKRANLEQWYIVVTQLASTILGCTERHLTDYATCWTQSEGSELGGIR